MTWPAKTMICALILCAFSSSGCLSFYRYRPFTVEVRDAETHMPIPDASVGIDYPLLNSNEAPTSSKAQTTKDGLAHVQAAVVNRDGATFTATAKGYTSYSEILASETIKQIKPSQWFEKIEKRPVSKHIELYKDPKFEVVLRLPLKYSGIIRAHTKLQETNNFPPGQRRFYYDVTTSGDVTINGPKILSTVQPANFIVQDESGNPVGSRIDANTVGCQWIHLENNNLNIFAVGKKAVYDQVYRDVLGEEAFNRRSEGNKSDDWNNPNRKHRGGNGGRGGSMGAMGGGMGGMGNSMGNGMGMGMGNNGYP